MTEKLKKSGLREDYFISKNVDGILDRVARNKKVRLILGILTGAGVGSTAGCVSVTPPPAEVAPVNEAVLSGVIGRDSLDKLSGNSKIIVENSLIYIGNKYAEDEKFVPGTEMIYAVGKGTDSFAWYLAGFKNEDGSVGLRVTDYCDSFVRDNENCQNVERDLLTVEGEGNRLYGYIDENNEQHPILLIDKDGNPIAFDINSGSYAERVANSDGFVEKIVSIGAMNVQAAAPEATATPQASETLSIVDTPTVTAEPTATATETSTATPSVEVDELGIRKEFARGEVMTKEEIKANVDWFYNLSDEELNKIVEGNLWSWYKYEGDSRPRDIDGNILREREDLGLFYSDGVFYSGGTSMEANYFNGIYLGTTTVESDIGILYISLLGTKDENYERMVLYGVSAPPISSEYPEWVLAEKLLDRVIHPSKPGPVSPSIALDKLLNSNMREVIAIRIDSDLKIPPTVPEISKIMKNLVTGGDDLIELLTEQRLGLNESGKDFVEERFPGNKLGLYYNEADLGNFSRFVGFIVHK